MISGAAFGWGDTFVNLGATKPNIFGAKQCQCFGGRTITPSTANFLIVGLDRFGQIGVGNPSNIRLIDPHTKGHRRHNDQPVLLLKATFPNAAIFGVHATMIMQRQMPRIAQGTGDPFGLGTRAAIYNPRLPFARTGKVEDLTARAVFGGKGKVDVRPIKPMQKFARGCAIKQLLNDLDLGFSIRSRGERRQRYVQCATQFPNPQIVRPEIVTPLADAMCFVHSD